MPSGAQAPAPTARFPPMATAEVTGAEEVAWDLSDLFEGIDDPRIDEVVGAGRAGRRRVPRALPRQGRGARRSEPRRGGRRARADRGGGRPAADLRPPRLRDQHGRPGARRARRAPRREGGRARDAASVLRARVGRRSGRHRRARCSPTRRSSTGGTTSGRCGSSGRTSSPSPRSTSSPRRPSRASRRGRGSTRSSSALSASRSTATTCRSRRRWRGCTTPIATPGGRRRGDHRGARPRPPDAHVRLQHHPAGQVDRRPDARLSDLDLVAQPRERDDRRGGRRAHRGDDVALRRPAALLPAQGPAARPRPARALRPVRAGLDRHAEDPVGRGPADRRRRLLRVLRRGGRDHRALLRRQLDRRAGAPRQAHRRVLRDDGARRAPVRAHELHGRPSLDPDARARARSRAPRRARAAARALQLVDPAHDRGDRVGVRRGTHVRAPARERGRPAAAARPARGADRGRDRDDVQADRDEPLRARGPHRAPRAGRARPERIGELWLEAQTRSSATRSPSRGTRPGGATSRISRGRPATSTRTPTAISSRSRSTGGT